MTTKQIVQFLASLYTSKPPEVTVLGTGALNVDAQRLLATPDAQKQLEALRFLHLEPSKHTEASAAE